MGLPYASVVAGIAFLSYLVGGACVGLGGVLACLIMWIVTLALFALALFAIKYFNKKKEANSSTDSPKETEGTAE